MALTVQDIRNMPLVWKVALGIAGVLLILYFYYFYFLQGNLARQDALREEQKTLAVRIAAKEKLVGEMDRYKKGIEELKQRFALVIQKLPEEKEIPGLMAAVSDAGRGSGLEFVLFEPMPLVKKEFYAEIPIKVVVKGTYREIHDFFTKVGGLSRVVNPTEAALSRGRDETGSGLKAECLMKTYMFVEMKDEEQGKGERKT
ncbi:MAG TPA: type 4a pilus biogenesis protein PilO [Syntrophales bacterium]|nr:type 4a pilus biogenesis protein PilO [Syntrophales bacterium]HPX11991.1 type 4a pilus biogenesis protein PilO [Syntrophales bacterium]HQB31308.1 type 4a pilus biogenesis protein PilO [Syntrophales bacterium]HQN78411.1 type 4a pilus biogenesis protein PilO [Syntrophales bacterium]HQQ27215.1 type 4a pilus biogenesis protein PilO [Syntrophales bacterium]